MSSSLQFWTIEALDPDDPTGCRTVTLRLNYAHTHCSAAGLDARFARMMLIPEVVRHPIMVLKGWKREGYEDAIIYVGRPPKDYRSTTIETPPPRDKVFMVFATPDNHSISDWRWEFSDENDPDAPEGMLSRCERVLWPTSQ